MVTEHGTVPSSWFGRGVWPRCVCGYDPHDNAALTEHYRQHGFTEVEDHGQIVRRDLHTDSAFERVNGFCRIDCAECKRLDAEDPRPQGEKAAAGLVLGLIAAMRYEKEQSNG